MPKATAANTTNTATITNNPMLGCCVLTVLGDCWTVVVWALVLRLATGKAVLLSGMPSLPPPAPLSRPLAVPGWTLLPGAAGGDPAAEGAEVCGL